MTIRDIAISFGYEIDKTTEKKANDSIKALKSTATKLLGAIGIGISLVKLKDISEEFNGINDQIRDATRGMGDQSEIQQTILKQANDARQSYADMADSVGKLARNTDVFSGVEDAANFSGLLYKNFMATGKSAAESQSLVQSLTTAISKGAVDSRAMMAMFRESPGTLRMMADAMGVTVDSLQDMVGKGQVSAKTLKQVFEKNAGAIDDRFGELDYSISDAMLNIRNQWGLWVDEMNSTTGITQSIAKFMVKAFNQVMRVLRKLQDGFMKLANKVGGVEKLMKLLAVVAGAIFVALNADKILTFLNGVGKLLSTINLKTMAIIAVIIILFLLIEDFINFMQGNDSLFGEMLKNMGIDADAVRAKIIAVWEGIKTSLSNIWNTIKTIASTIWGGLVEFWQSNGDTIMAILKNIWEFIAGAFKVAWIVLSTTIDVVSSAVSGLIGFIAGLVTSVSNSIKWLKEHETAFGLIALAIGTVTTALIAYNTAQAIARAGGLQSIAETAILKGMYLADAIAKGISTAATWAMTAASTAASVATWAFGAAMAFLTSPITLIILAIGALIAIIYLLIKNWDTVKEVAANCWEWIKGVWNNVASWFKTTMIDPIVKYYTGLWDAIKAIFSVVANWFKGIFEKAWNYIAGSFSNAVKFYKGIWDGIVAIFSAVGQWFSGVFTAAWDGIVGVWSAVIGWFSGLWNGIVSIFSVVGEWFGSVFRSAWQNIMAAFSTLVSFFQGLWDAIKSMFTTIGTTIGDAIGGAFKTVVNAIIGFAERTINGFISAINGAIGLINNIPGVSIPQLNLLNIPRLAEGGYVSANRPRLAVIGDNPREGEIVAPESKIFTVVMDALRMFASQAIPQRATVSAASAANNNSVTQNNYFTNQFYGDRAGQQKSAEAMEKSADDATGLLARGLAYAR